MMMAPSTGLPSGPRTEPDSTGGGVGFGAGLAAAGLGRGLAAAGLFGGGVGCVCAAARAKTTLSTVLMRQAPRRYSSPGSRPGGYFLIGMRSDAAART